MRMGLRAMEHTHALPTPGSRLIRRCHFGWAHRSGQPAPSVIWAPTGPDWVGFALRELRLPTVLGSASGVSLLPGRCFGWVDPLPNGGESMDGVDGRRNRPECILDFVMGFCTCQCPSHPGCPCGQSSH
jgi:hypothetical protein